MRRFKWIGTLMFYISIPGLYFYLQKDERTRVIVKVGDEILVLKGWYGSNRWMLPGGGMHKGEGRTEGAARELREETGIAIDPSRLTYIASGPVADSYGLKYEQHIFILILDARPEVNISNSEISAHDWRKPEQLIADKKHVLKASRSTLMVWLDHENLV